MTQLTVNGRPITADIQVRTHLADLLRDHLLLTGTHTGCEHGVCGACTVLLDDEPIRACITWPALLDQADIRTIEGLEHDSIIIRLREAFSLEHALQCGYCTPGMLVTARDIVRRLPHANDDRIRLELAGNLCRCTGYNGIVRAIRRVLDEHLDLPPQTLSTIPQAQFGTAKPAATTTTQPNKDGLHQRLPFEVPAAILWTVLQDPALIAACIPGATLATVQDGKIEGQMQVALGPIRVRFNGQAELTYDPKTRSGTVQGAGSDQSSGTRLTAEATFHVLEQTPATSTLAIDIEYALRGPLSQLAKGRVVDLLAGEIATAFGQALAARLRGEAAPAAAPLSAFTLFLRTFQTWFRSRFSPKPTPGSGSD